MMKRLFNKNVSRIGMRGSSSFRKYHVMLGNSCFQSREDSFFEMVPLSVQSLSINNATMALGVVQSFVLPRGFLTDIIVPFS